MDDKIKSANQQLNEMWEQKDKQAKTKTDIYNDIFAWAVIPVNPYAGSNQNAR